VKWEPQLEKHIFHLIWNVFGCVCVIYRSYTRIYTHGPHITALWLSLTSPNQIRHFGYPNKKKNTFCFLICCVFGCVSAWTTDHIYKRIDTYAPHSASFHCPLNFPQLYLGTQIKKKGKKVFSLYLRYARVYSYPFHCAHSLMPSNFSKSYIWIPKLQKM